MGCERTGKTTPEHEERKWVGFHIIHPDLRQSRGEITAKAGRDGCRDRWCVYGIEEFGQPGISYSYVFRPNPPSARSSRGEGAKCRGR